MFRKYNHSHHVDALLREAEGLEALRHAARGSGISVPVVVAVDEQQLEMEAISAASCSGHQWRMLGEGLAHIHQCEQSSYGWETDNYIGLNPQKNGLSDNWGEFFVARRLEYQLGLIRNARVRASYQARLARCRKRLVEFLNAHCSQPSLVHGDLWSGNYLCGDQGGVWLIDPAVYRGDREVDIAMTEMFGGFDAAFYAAYNRCLPPSSGYQQKRPIYNLYHYLNHYNLFGDNYLQGCEADWAAIGGL